MAHESLEESAKLFVDSGDDSVALAVVRQLLDDNQAETVLLFLQDPRHKDLLLFIGYNVLPMCVQAIVTGAVEDCGHALWRTVELFVTVCSYKEMCIALAEVMEIYTFSPGQLYLILGAVRITLTRLTPQIWHKHVGSVFPSVHRQLHAVCTNAGATAVSASCSAVKAGESPPRRAVCCLRPAAVRGWSMRQALRHSVLPEQTAHASVAANTGESQCASQSVLSKCQPSTLSLPCTGGDDCPSCHDVRTDRPPGVETASIGACTQAAHTSSPGHTPRHVAAACVYQAVFCVHSLVLKCQHHRPLLPLPCPGFTSTLSGESPPRLLLAVIMRLVSESYSPLVAVSITDKCCIAATAGHKSHAARRPDHSAKEGPQQPPTECCSHDAFLCLMEILQCLEVPTAWLFEEGWECLALQSRVASGTDAADVAARQTAAGMEENDASGNDGASDDDGDQDGEGSLYGISEYSLSCFTALLLLTSDVHSLPSIYRPEYLLQCSSRAINHLLSSTQPHSTQLALCLLSNVCARFWELLSAERARLLGVLNLAKAVCKVLPSQPQKELRFSMGCLSALLHTVEFPARLQLCTDLLQDRSVCVAFIAGFLINNCIATIASDKVDVSMVL